MPSGRSLNFWTLRVGAYSRWARFRGQAGRLSNFRHSQQVLSLFCNKTINNNKTSLRSWMEYCRACEANARQWRRSRQFSRQSRKIQSGSFPFSSRLRRPYSLFTVKILRRTRQSRQLRRLSRRLSNLERARRKNKETRERDSRLPRFPAPRARYYSSACYAGYNKT